MRGPRRTMRTVMRWMRARWMATDSVSHLMIGMMADHPPWREHRDDETFERKCGQACQSMESAEAHPRTHDAKSVAGWSSAAATPPMQRSRSHAHFGDSASVLSAGGSSVRGAESAQRKRRVMACATTSTTCPLLSGQRQLAWSPRTPRARASQQTTDEDEKTRIAISYGVRRKRSQVVGWHNQGAFFGNIDTVLARRDGHQRSTRSEAIANVLGGCPLEDKNGF